MNSRNQTCLKGYFIVVIKNEVEWKKKFIAIPYFFIDPKPHCYFLIAPCTFLIGPTLQQTSAHELLKISIDFFGIT